MVSLLEIAHRARTGPKINEQEWNLLLFHKSQELTKDFGLEDLGSETYIDIDHDYADKAFQAAIRFLVEVGILMLPVNRIIKFTENEVKEQIRHAPSELTVGEGRDARRIYRREIEDKRSCNVNSALHAPYSEDLVGLVVKNFAQIPRLDIIEGFNTTAFDGYEIYSRPFEAYAAIRELAYMREGIRKAGRPGLAIHLYPINTGAHAMIAPLDPRLGLRRTDGVLLKPLPDLKVEMNYLTAAIVYENYGNYVKTGGGSQIGGFCGGPGGAILEAINHLIGGLLVYHGSFGNTGVGYVRVGGGRANAKVTPRPVWPAAVVHHALCRNSKIIKTSGVTGWSGGSWGIGSAMHLRTIAINAMTATVLGSHIDIIRTPMRGIMLNRSQTPLETEWAVEVSEATIKAGMGLKDVEDVMKTVNKRYEGTPIPRYQPRLITEVYDLVRHRPRKPYQQAYTEVKREYTDLGLEFE